MFFYTVGIKRGRMEKNTWVDVCPSLNRAPYYPSHRTTVDATHFDVCRWKEGGGVDMQNIPRVSLPCIYVLACQHGFFYVGLTDTSNLSSRLSCHFQGCGARCTRRHRPLYVHQVLYNGSKQLEDRVVQYLCERMGPVRVRGGQWCTGPPPIAKVPGLQ